MRAITLLFWVFSLAACSAISGTDIPGSDPSSAGDTGTSNPDGGPGPDIDTGVVPGDDAGPPPSCADGDTRCEGTVVVECLADGERRTDCAATGEICITQGETARCRDRVCMPGTSMCNEAATQLLTCSDDGSMVSSTACMNGCDPATNACADSPPACAGLPDLTPGTHTYDLCGAGNDETYIPMGECHDRATGNGEDLVLVLTLDHDSNVDLVLMDADTTSSIDTIVYIRSVCDDASTQVACDDDTPCADAASMIGCNDGWQVRESQIDTRLPAGTYYVVIDTIDYTSSTSRFGCGRVAVSLRVDPG